MKTRLAVSTVVLAIAGAAFAPAAPRTQTTQVMRVYAAFTPGVVAPVPIERPTLSYTPEAIQARFQGQFTADVTVGTDGRVADVLVKTAPSPNYGLEEQFVAVLSRWTFTPGTVNGRIVPVRQTISMDLHLQ